MRRSSETSRIEARIRALTLRLLDARNAADRASLDRERAELCDRLEDAVILRHARALMA